jgi:hypothetical protein
MCFRIIGVIPTIPHGVATQKINIGIIPNIFWHPRLFLCCVRGYSPDDEGSRHV